MFKHAFTLTSITAFILTIMAFAPLNSVQAAAKGKSPTLNAFNKKSEKGVTVWRANLPAKTPVKEAAISNTQNPNSKANENNKIKAGTKIRFKRSDIRAKPSTRSRIRVIGHYSGFGQRAQITQGFYSGYKNNRKRRFPLQRPDGKRRVTRRFY